MTRFTPSTDGEIIRNRLKFTSSDEMGAAAAWRPRPRSRRRRLQVGNAAPSSRRQWENDRLCVGVDVTRVAEVAAALRRFGRRYLDRVFTPREQAYCRAAAGSAAAQRFAARFAAKEAAVKALGPDRPWSDWRAIEIRRHKSGRCTIVLHGHAAVLAARRGIRHLAVSMTHDEWHAAAIVVALRTQPITHTEC
jgi:holo-[acyl-carrier protein] synthase